MKISELAHQAGVGVETVRYYQRRGLLGVPPRPLGTYRRYSLNTVDTIRHIRLLQELGLSLGEIQGLLQGDAEECRDVRSLLDQHILATQRELTSLRWRLRRLQQALKEVPCGKNRLSCGLACLAKRTESRAPARKDPSGGCRSD